MLGSLGCAVKSIRICDLQDGTFFARIFLKQGEREYDVDSRPSDAIAIALRYDAPILVREDILRDNSVPIKQTQEKEEDKDSAKPSRPKSKTEMLREQLKRAVTEEHYEEAARLRDELKQMGQSADYGN